MAATLPRYNSLPLNLTQRVLRVLAGNGTVSAGWEIQEGTVEGYKFLVRAPIDRAIIESVKSQAGGEFLLHTRHCHWNPIFSAPAETPTEMLEKLFLDYWKDPQAVVAGQSFKRSEFMDMNGIAGLQENERRRVNALLSEMPQQAAYQHRMVEITPNEKWSDGPIVWEDRQTKPVIQVEEPRGMPPMYHMLFPDLKLTEKQREIINECMESAAIQVAKQSRKVMEEVEQLVIGQDSQYTFGGIELSPEISKEMLDGMAITTPKEWPTLHPPFSKQDTDECTPIVVMGHENHE